MNTGDKENLSLIPKTSTRRKTQKNDPGEQEITGKIQVHRAVRSKSDYLIKASISLNEKQCTLFVLEM
jgi:hypothetical protein